MVQELYKHNFDDDMLANFRGEIFEKYLKDDCPKDKKRIYALCETLTTKEKAHEFLNKLERTYVNLFE